ncbi:MAG: response regulator transcription factor [Bryobacteraceae bacterium]
MPTRILIADDHLLIRHGIRTILASDPTVTIVGEATDGLEAVSMAEKLRPDIAIIDLSMKNLNGIDATSQIARRLPATGVIVLSMYSDERYVNRAVRAGAKAYVVKDSTEEDLIRAIRAVQAGQTYFSPGVAKLLLEAYTRNLTGKNPEAEDRYGLLTEREREIFQLLAEGNSNKAIATSFGLSIHTVETHRIRLMKKLDVHNTAELVLCAVNLGLVGRPAEC